MKYILGGVGVIFTLWLFFKVFYAVLSPGVSEACLKRALEAADKNDPKLIADYFASNCAPVMLEDALDGTYDGFTTLK